MTRLFVPLLAALLALIAGCGGAPAVEPPPPPVTVTVSIAATADVNPDAEQRPSPLVVRLYELADAESFSRGDFFALWSQEQATLADSLVKRHELVLSPAGSTSRTLTLDPRVQAIGVAAGYRDIRNAVWRAVVPVAQDPKAPRALTISVEAAQRALTARPKNPSDSDAVKAAGTPP